MDEINTEVMPVPEPEPEVMKPKYVLKLGVPVTHRWRDKDGKAQSHTYDVGVEMGVVFAGISKLRHQRWVDCVTPDGIMLTIGHNSKHRIIKIEETLDKPLE